jgi:hypothetical protein
MKQLVAIESTGMVVDFKAGPTKAVEISLSVCSVEKELVEINLERKLEKKFKVETVEFVLDITTLDIMLKTLTDIRKGFDK